MAQDPPGQEKWAPLGQSEPLEPRAQHAEHLWRNIAFAALGLAALLAGAQIYQSNPHREPDQACNLRRGAGELITGRVTRFLSAQEALSLIQLTQAHINGTISPDYVTQKRVGVDVLGESGRRPTVLVPENMTVNIGDIVEFASAHRAPGLPCHYIPNLISRVVAPASG